MDYGFDAADSHKAMQTDTCHGTCGSGCPSCAGMYEINFHPDGFPMQPETAEVDTINNTAG
jgi:hypothetical protein